MDGDETRGANEGERGGSQQPSTRPPIVGIGASAGGIKALQVFFEALPDRVGAAFCRDRASVTRKPQRATGNPRGADPHAGYAGD